MGELIMITLEHYEVEYILRRLQMLDELATQLKGKKLSVAAIEVACDDIKLLVQDIKRELKGE